MDYPAFLTSLNESACPITAHPCLAVLWFEAKGDWDRAHEIVQALPDGLAEAGAARIHAYLHRKEGDLGNSRYWHRRAGSRFPDHLSLQEEWELLVRSNLSESK
jgi:hypothetical protein